MRMNISPAPTKTSNCAHVCSAPSNSQSRNPIQYQHQAKQAVRKSIPKITSPTPLTSLPHPSTTPPPPPEPKSASTRRKHYLMMRSQCAITKEDEEMSNDSEGDDGNGDGVGHLRYGTHCPVPHTTVIRPGSNIVNTAITTSSGKCLRTF